MNEPIKLPPFKHLCMTIGNLPSSYVDSMSYYECLMWLCKYLKDTVIPAINNNAEAVKEIQDWIDTVDLQDYVDEKLDEMAEDGTLAQIIEDYATIPELTTRVGNLETSVTTITNNELSEIAVVGDSYTALENSTWAEDVADQLHLTLHKSAQSALGYLRVTQSNTYFIDLLNRFTNSEFTDIYMSETERNKTKYLITYGGINDYGSTENELRVAVTTYCARAKEIFPNAQIIIVGPQMGAGEYSLVKQLTITKGISEGALASGCSYVDSKDWLINTPYSTSDTYANDNLHPSALGFKIITSKMLGLITGNDSVTNEITITLNSSTLTDGKASIKRTKDSLIVNIYARGVFNNGAVTDIATISAGGATNYIEDTRYPVYKRDSSNCPTTLLGGICVRSGNTISVINNSGADYTGRIIANFVIPIAPYDTTL